MSKFTDKDLNAMTLADLQDLSKRIKIAEKALRQNANKEVASSLVPGDQVEFTIPKTNEVKTGTVLKVKRVMIALKASDNSPWNIPLTAIGKKIASAPASKTKAVKKTAKTVAKAKPGVKASKPKVTKTTSKAVKTKASKTPVVKKAEKSSSDVIKAIREKIAAKKSTESVKKTAAVAPTQEEATAE